MIGADPAGAAGDLAVVNPSAGVDITAEELDKTRNAKVGRWMMRLLSSMSQAYYLAMAELDGNVARYGQMLAGYDSLTLADLQRVWNSYLAAQPLVTVVVD